MHFACPPHLPHALTTSFLMILSAGWYLVSSAEHEASVIHFPYSPVTSSHLGPNVFHNTPHHQPTFLPQCGTQGLAAMQNNRETCSSVYFDLCVLDSKLEGKRFYTE